MAIPVTEVKATILAFLGELKAAVCEAHCDQQIDFEYEETLKITMQVIAPSGPNSLTRTTLQTDGEKVQTVEQPEKLETQTTDESVSTTVAGAGTSTTSTTRTEPEQRVTRTQQPKTSTTQKSGTAAVSETTDDQDSHQDSYRNTGGGNRTTQTHEFDRLA